MDKQNKNLTPKKDGDPRISVRPGNFIIPGEKPKESHVGRTAPKSAQSARQDEGTPTGGGKHKNRRRGRRGGRGNGTQQQGGEARVTAAPRQQAKPAQPVTVEGEKKQLDTKKGNRRDRRGRGGKHDRRDERAVTQAPEISESLKKELDHDLSFTSPLSYPSLTSLVKRKAEQESPAVDTKEFEVDIATAAYLLEDVPCGFPAPDGKAVEIIGVRFRQSGKIYFFDPAGERFKIGEAAIVDTARGPEIGNVVMLNRKMAEKDIVQPLRAVLRRATAEDIAHDAENHKKEAEAMKLCAEKIAQHKLDMTLVDAQYTFDNTKLLFYFTSEGRVDFRDLVRDLAGVFRTRIELRQIGIRDESRLIGGLGMCGRPFCCSTFLSDFGQVSVKMAKEQGLSINTSKISGCCGRLMCCLRYEHESYALEAAQTPKKGARVTTPDGIGTVVDAAPLSGMVKVALDSAQDVAPTAYHRDKLTPVEKPQAQPSESAEDATEAD